MTDNNIMVVCPLQVPEKVTLVACQLLLSLATTVRPRFLTSMSSVGDLMRKASHGELTALPQKVHEVKSVYSRFTIVDICNLIAVL